MAFEPVAPGVTFDQCREDIAAADADGDERITRAEFLTFMEAFGERVCFERSTNSTELTAAESVFFDTLVCVVAPACQGLNEIIITESIFTGTVANAVCTLTYSSGLNAPVCDGREATAAPVAAGTTAAPAQASPTDTPPTDTPPSTTAPLSDPDNTNSMASRRMGGYTQTMVVLGAAIMLGYMWM